MLRRITLENFMSHARSVIELADGLTVLVGPNNCGKSAVVEALRTLCNNTAGDFMLRHGEKEVRVTVETDDGHTLVWRRKGAVVSYVVNGREVHRLKGSVPEDLHELLRLPPVTLPQGEEIDIHFGLQKAPIFLLDEPESRIAAFFSASSDAEKLMRMQQLHRDKVRNARRKQQDLNEEIDHGGKQLAALDPLDAVQPLIEIAEAEYEATQKEMEAIRSLHGMIERMEQGTLACRRFERQLRTLEQLPPPPAIDDARPLERLIASCELAMVTQRREAERASTLSALAGPPTLEDERSLQNLCAKIAFEEGKRACIARAAESLSTLHEPPAAPDTRKLEDLIAHWTNNRTTATQRAVDVVELDQQLAQVRQQIQTWADANPTCPVCGAPVDPDRLVEGETEEEGGHRHG